MMRVDAPVQTAKAAAITTGESGGSVGSVIFSMSSLLFLLILWERRKGGRGKRTTT
jgi:hypothetical protein